MKVNNDFFQSDDVVSVARQMLGMYLVSEVDGNKTVGKIVETEAYSGRGDRACHANDNKRTKRTEAMYRAGGTAYVYLCYGMHHLFNVVTNVEGLADAVLVRALEPVDGLDVMKERYGKVTKYTNGPAKLSKAMGIDVSMTGFVLGESCLSIHQGQKLSDDEITVSTRIGVDYAGDDASLPWRFYEKDNLWVSKK